MDDLNDVHGFNIPLSEMIQTLRQELQLAMRSSADEALRFKLDKIELELQVEVTRGAKGGAKLDFKVLSAEAQRERGSGLP